jgi:hypothetical protein
LDCVFILKNSFLKIYRIVLFISLCGALIYSAPSHAQAQSQTAAVKTAPVCNLEGQSLKSCCAQGHVPSCAQLEVYQYPPDIQKLRTFCYAQHQAVACDKYLSIRADNERRNATEKQSPVEAEEEPNVCKKQHPQYDAKSCQAAMNAAATKSLTKLLSDFSSMYGPPFALSNSLLQEKESLCKKLKSEILCDGAVDGYWDAKRFSDALRITKYNCQKKFDTYACKTYQKLQPHASALATGGQDITALPCGEFTIDGGVLAGLDVTIGDYGKVDPRLAGLNARLENGNIHIRHDKNGDFILRLLKPNIYMGVDTFNRQAIFTLASPAKECKQPKAH